MSGGLQITKGSLPEGTAALLLARVVDTDGTVLADSELLTPAGSALAIPNGGAAANGWCLNVYDLSSDTPNRDVWQDIQALTWTTSSTFTGLFVVGETVTGSSTGAIGTVLAVTNSATNGLMNVTDLRGPLLFDVSADTITGTTSEAVLVATGTMTEVYEVPHCGAGSGDDSTPANLAPLFTLSLLGWDIDPTGHNFSMDLQPGHIVDTDDSGATVTGWRGGHTYRVEVTLTLGTALTFGEGTTKGVTTVAFEFAINPTIGESTL